MMRECWTHLASMLTWHSSPFPQLDRRCVSTGIRTHLQCPFRNGVLTRQMEEFNASMSSVLQVKFLDYKKNPQNWP